jgi:hypothetical protein
MFDPFGACDILLFVRYDSSQSSDVCVGSDVLEVSLSASFTGGTGVSTSIPVASPVVAVAVHKNSFGIEALTSCNSQS